MTELLEARMKAMIRGNPLLMEALVFAMRLDLPDWMVVSGAIYQTVWNALTGRPPGYGLKDVDLVYFDPDTSWEAEDAVIRRSAAAAPPALSELVEVRNQARVHLWFEQRFGEPYAPLSSTADALRRYVAPAFAVGVRLEGSGDLMVAAPFGLEDLFAMRVRRNPTRAIAAQSFERAASSCRSRWPEVLVEAAADPFAVQDKGAG